MLTAARNWELLAAQARRFNPLRVVIACEEFLPNLRDALAGTSVRVEGAGVTVLSVPRKGHP